MSTFCKSMHASQPAFRMRIQCRPAARRLPQLLINPCITEPRHTKRKKTSKPLRGRCLNEDDSKHARPQHSVRCRCGARLRNPACRRMSVLSASVTQRGVRRCCVAQGPPRIRPPIANRAQPKKRHNEGPLGECRCGMARSATRWLLG